MKVVAFVVFSLLFLHTLHALNNAVVETHLGYGYPRQGNTPQYYIPSTSSRIVNTPLADFDSFITSYNVNGFVAATWQTGQPLAQVDTLKMHLEFPPSDRDRYIGCTPRIRQLTFDSVITDRAQLMAAPMTQTGAQKKWASLEFLTRANAPATGWYTFEFSGNASDATSWQIGAVATAQGKAFEVSIVDIICFGDAGFWTQVYMTADSQADPNLKVSGVLSYNWTFEASYDSLPDNQLSAGVPVNGANAILYHLFANPVHYVGGFPRAAPETPSLAVPTLSATTVAYTSSSDDYYWIFGSHIRGTPLTAITSVDVYLTNVPTGTIRCALGWYQVNFADNVTSRADIQTTGSVSLAYGSQTLPTNITGNGWYTFRAAPINLVYDRFRLSSITVGYRGSLGASEIDFFNLVCSDANGPVNVSIVADITQQEPNNPLGGLQTPVLQPGGYYTAPLKPEPGMQAIYYQLQGKTYNFVEPATSAPTPNPGTDYSGVRCQTQACCESYQQPNADTGNGYWELSSICSAGIGGTHCIQETGCNLCHDPSAPYSSNPGNRPFCQRFIPTGECTSQQCCTMRQIPNVQTGNGYLQYDTSCKPNGGLHCMSNTGCKFCYIPVFDSQTGMMTNNLGNRPICSFA